MPHNIQSLPNEVIHPNSTSQVFLCILPTLTSNPQILIQILTPFSTRALLPLAPTSPRFSSLILRILHYRLLLAASLSTYKLLLEAYHPTRRDSEPYLFCTYLGTPGLAPTHEACEGPTYEDITAAEQYAKLSHLYSRFRPEKPGVEGSMPKRPYPAGGSGSQTDSGSSSQPVYTNGGDGGTAKVEFVINLDSHELFSQFCATALLVKLGPRRGVFLSAVGVEEKVMRVWREWLDARAAAATRDQPKRRKAQREEATNLESTTADDAGEQGHQQEVGTAPSPSVLWTDHNHNLGLVVSITERRWRTRTAEPILISAAAEAEAEEEQPVSYSIEIKGTSPNPTIRHLFPD